MSQYPKLSLLALIVLSCIGCGSDQVRVYPVSGKITLDGKPMEGGGTIAFFPADGQEGKAPGGMIDDDGNYKLSTYGDGDGSMAGKFKVVIMQTTVDEPEATPDGQKPPEALPALAQDKMIPRAYSDPKGTPLTVEVKEEANEDVNFDLKRDVVPANAVAPIVGA